MYDFKAPIYYLIYFTERGTKGFPGIYFIYLRSSPTHGCPGWLGTLGNTGKIQKQETYLKY